jgi:hypothetical protein
VTETSTQCGNDTSASGYRQVLKRAAIGKTAGSNREELLYCRRTGGIYNAASDDERCAEKNHHGTIPCQFKPEISVSLK